MRCSIGTILKTCKSSEPLFESDKSREIMKYLVCYIFVCFSISRLLHFHHYIIIDGFDCMLGLHQNDFECSLKLSCVFATYFMGTNVDTMLLYVFSNNHFIRMNFNEKECFNILEHGQFFVFSILA